MCVCFWVGGEFKKKKITKLNILMCFYSSLMSAVEAESLCLRLTEKISTNTERKLLLSHTPLLLVALEVR